MAKRLTDVDRAIQILDAEITVRQMAKQALLDARLAKPARAPKKRKLEAVPASEAVR